MIRAARGQCRSNGVYYRSLKSRWSTCVAVRNLSELRTDHERCQRESNVHHRWGGLGHIDYDVSEMKMNYAKPCMTWVLRNQNAVRYMHSDGDGHKGEINESGREPSGDLSADDMSRFKRDMAKIKRYGLNKSKLPLGTMTNDDWDAMLAVINNRRDMSATPNGSAADSASKILKRLVSEYSATSSHDTKVKILRDRFDAIMTGYRSVLDLWRSVISHHPNSFLAHDRGEAVLLGLMNWTEAEFLSGSTVSNFPVEDIAFITNGWLNLESGIGLERAVGLIMACTNSRWVPIIPSESAVILFPCIQEIDSRQSSSGHQNSIATRRLRDRIKQLQKFPGWEGLSAPESVHAETSETRELLSGKKETLIAPKNPPILSFEARLLLKEMIGVVQNATKDDIENVALLEENLMSLTKDSKEVMPDLCYEFMEYYVRVFDPEKAFEWLERCVMSTKHSLSQSALTSSLPPSPSLTSDHFLRIMNLWINNEESSEVAPWRVDELLRRAVRLEEDEEYPRFEVDRFLYEACLRAWSQSSDPIANRKLQEVISQLKSRGIQVNPSALPSTANSIPEDAERLSILDDASADASDSMHDAIGDNQQQIAESASNVIAQHNTSAERVQDFITQVLAKEIKFTESMSYNVVQALGNSSAKPSSLMDFLTTLEERGESPSNRTYVSAAYSVLKSDEEGAIDLAVQLFYRALDSAQGTEFYSMLQEPMRIILSRVESIQGFDRADSLLRTVETRSIKASNDLKIEPFLPFDCYWMVMRRHKDDPESAPKVVALFERMLEHMKKMKIKARPYQKIYESYITALFHVGADTAKIEKVVRGLMAEYENRTDDQWSKPPTASMFEHLMRAWARDTTPENDFCLEALELYDDMLRIGVEPKLSIVEHALMFVIKHREQGDGGNDGIFPERISQLLDHIQDYNLTIPDFGLFKDILKSCRNADPNHHTTIFSVCLKVLVLCQRRNAIDDCSRKLKATRLRFFILVLRLCEEMKPLHERQQRNMDKVAKAIFGFCCEDGLLEPSLTKRFQRLMTQPTWEQVYSSRLVKGSQPPDWSRNVVPLSPPNRKDNQRNPNRKDNQRNPNRSREQPNQAQVNQIAVQQNSG